MTPSTNGYLEVPEMGSGVDEQLDDVTPEAGRVGWGTTCHRVLWKCAGLAITTQCKHLDLFLGWGLCERMYHVNSIHIFHLLFVSRVSPVELCATCNCRSTLFPHDGRDHDLRWRLNLARHSNVSHDDTE